MIIGPFAALTRTSVVHLRRRLLIDIISLFRGRPGRRRRREKKPNRNEIEFPAKRLRRNGCYLVALGVRVRKHQRDRFARGSALHNTPVDHRSGACVIVVVAVLPASRFTVSLVLLYNTRTDLFFIIFNFSQSRPT